MKGKINQSDMRYVQSKFEEFKRRETFASEREALSALARLEKLLSEDAEYGPPAFREYLQGIVKRLLDYYEPICRDDTVPEGATLEWLTSCCGIGLELRRYDMASVTREDIDRAPAWRFPADYESDLVMAAEGRYLPKSVVKTALRCSEAELNELVRTLPRSMLDLRRDGSLEISEGALYLLSEGIRDPYEWPNIVVTKKHLFVSASRIPTMRR